MLNAQQPFGADVISRITATMLDPGALGRAAGAGARDARRRSTAEVCEEAGVDPGEVYEIVVAGNVTMIQLALGIDPEPLSMAPFTIAARQLPEATAADFGVHGARARAGRAVPGARRVRRAGHRRRHARDRASRSTSAVRLFIDVGTNSEIVLGSSARALATRGAGRAGVRGGPDPLRHARGRRARSKA